VPRRVIGPSSRIAPLCAFLWTAFSLLAGPYSNTANAQTFKVSLEDLTVLYDRLYPERTQRAVWDTTAAFDFDTLPLGNQNYKTPNPFKTDASRTKTIVEYGAVSGYRFTYTLPRTYSFVFGDSSAGEFILQKPRNLSIPDLQIAIVPYDSVVSEVWWTSLRDVWRETTVATIEAQRITGIGGGRGGINIPLPIPMPKQLESIFGPSEKTHINITGREEITFAGETRRVKPFLGTESRQRQSLFPTLDMKQSLDVRLTGTIGDKVNIQVDHSSEAVSSDANRIRLNYTGYEDDVIQLIELGNTSLSLPGSQLVNFSTQSKGLFGVKVLAQLGGTDVTVIASKQEGETSSASFSPSAGAIGTAERIEIQDVDFVKDKYFFFNHPNYMFRSNLPQLSSIDIYREVKPSDLLANPELGVFHAWAVVDTFGTGEDVLAAVDSFVAGKTAPTAQYGDFELLTRGEDYVFVLDATTLDPVGIELLRSISDNEQRMLAVSYVNRSDQRTGGFIYNELPPSVPAVPSPTDTLVLELLKDRSPRPDGARAYLWEYMMRNIYNLRLSNIDPANFRVEIEDNIVVGRDRLDYTTPDSVAVPYIQIFGLDRFDTSGQPGADKLIDLQSGVVDLQNGILTFPVLHPFAPPEDSVRKWTDNQFWFKDPKFDGRFVDQYDRSAEMYQVKPSSQTFQNAHQYTIVIEAVSTTKTFRINALNLIENSEVVTLDGNRLARGTDYDIDYDTGEINLKGNILNELTPASKINIDYEYKPFGGGASSNLVGFNTLSHIGKNARLGTTWLYESKNVSAEKPRVGEEPTRAVVGGVNGSIQHQSEFLTDVVNKLPLVDTDDPSTINLSGEIAMSIPDPNTRGEAYIDDFEGVEDSDRISMTRRSWYQASPPVINDGNDTYIFPDTSRWKFIWYNIEQTKAPHKRDLNPGLDDKENSVVPALDIEVDPVLPAPTDTTAWVGVLTGFGGGGLDLTQGQFLEVWVNDFKPDPNTRGGKLHIDFGDIDEDFFEPAKNQFNDEDKARDGFAAAFDDTGLDGLFNAEEGATDANPDPHGDDYDSRYINDRYEKINGTENNQYYDTEDLDRSGQLDQLNAYYSFVIDLSDSAVVDIRERYPGYDGFTGEHENDSWRLYRIKLSDAVPVEPTGAEPQIDQVRHMRVWFNNINDVVRTGDGKGKRRLQIAELKIVGNRWEEDGVRDLQDHPRDMPVTEFAIGVISTKSDPGVYDPPIRPNVDNEVAEKETSLFLRYDNLTDSTQVRILKRFSGSGMDLTLYRELHFWVHTDKVDPDLQYYFRLGTNENNFYEVAVPLTQAYITPSGWTRAVIRLEDLTALKLAPSDSVVYGSAPDQVEDRAYPVAMVGAPSLFGVRFLYAGVRSVGTMGQVHSGELWIDDIFVGAVQRDIDYAQRLSGSLNLGGGVFSINAGWTRTGPDFRGLRQRRGSGTLSQSYNVSARTNVMHFLPLAGFSIPVSGSYTKSISRPKFVPNSDTEISDPALQDSLQTVSINRGFSTSFAKKGSENPLLKYTVDKLATNFSYSRSTTRSPASTDTTTSMTGTLGYQITWQGRHAIGLGKNIAFRYWPNSLDIRTAASRRTSQRWRFIGGEYRKDPFLFDASLKNSGSVNYSPLKSVTSAFNMTIDRDVRLPHEWLGVDVGTEIRRNHGLQVTYNPPPMWLLKELSPNFSVSNGYTEDSSPNVRGPGDPVGTRNVTSNRSAQAKMRFDVGKVFKGLFGKLGMDVSDRKRAAAPRPVRQTAGAPTDTSGAPGDTAQAPSRPRADPKIALRKLAQIMTEIRRVNVNVTHRTGNSYARIPNRPSLLYQLGLDKDTGVRAYQATYDTPDRLTTGLNLVADSGVQLTEDIDVATRYARTTSNSDFLQSKSRAVSTTFPDVQLSWKGLERIGLFSPIFMYAAANFNYKKFKQESGRPESKTPDSIREALTMSPSLQFTWKNDIRSTLGVAWNKNTTETRGAKSETTNLSVNLDFKKVFSGGSGFKLPIPLFRKELKWKSQLDTALSLAYTRTGGKRFVGVGVEPVPIPSNTSIRVSPNVGYHFSQALSGRAFVDYGRSHNEATNQTITTVRIGVTAVFTF